MQEGAPAVSDPVPPQCLTAERPGGLGSEDPLIRGADTASNPPRPAWCHLAVLGALGLPISHQGEVASRLDERRARPMVAQLERCPARTDKGGSMKIDPNNYSIAEIRDMLKRKDLVVNDDYQRAPRIWPAGPRSYFIDASSGDSHFRRSTSTSSSTVGRERRSARLLTASNESAQSLISWPTSSDDDGFGPFQGATLHRPSRHCTDALLGLFSAR